MLFHERGKVCGIKDDICNESDVKRLCIFHKFPYFKDIAIRHTFDFMHTEKNIAYAIIETFFGAYDIVASREYF